MNKNIILACVVLLGMCFLMSCGISDLAADNVVMTEENNFEVIDLSSRPSDLNEREIGNISDYRIDISTLGGQGTIIETSSVKVPKYGTFPETYPVYINKYIYDQAGPTFDMDDEYQQNCANALREFVSIWQGSNYIIHDDQIVFEAQAIGRSTYIYNEDICINSDPRFMSVWIENQSKYIDMSNIENILTNSIVVSMLDYCDIKDLSVQIKESIESDGTRNYEYVITNNYGNEHIGIQDFAYVMVSYVESSQTVGVVGAKHIYNTYGEYAIITPEMVVEDLESLYNGEIHDTKYEILYSSNVDAGYYVPCYKFYVQEEGSDKYDVHYYRMCIVD